MQTNRHQISTLMVAALLSLPFSAAESLGGFTQTDTWEVLYENFDPAIIDIRSIAFFEGFLFAGTRGIPAKIMRYGIDGKGTWEMVVDDGFGDPENIDIDAMAVWNGFLYAGTGNPNQVEGPEIWRSSDGDTWEKVLDLAAWTDCGELYGGLEFQDRLYFGVDDHISGAVMWRSATGAMGTWEACSANGFGDHRNGRFYGMCVFAGQLYVGTSNYESGAEIWRTDDGTQWECVMQGAFGIGGAYECLFTLVEFKSLLYAGVGDVYPAVYRSMDGENWELVDNIGFGDPSNLGVIAMGVAGDSLYAMLRNDTEGAQAWYTIDGAQWHCSATGGFGCSGSYMCPYMTMTAGSQIYAACGYAAILRAPIRQPAVPASSFTGVCLCLAVLSLLLAGITRQRRHGSPAGIVKPGR
ncbi:hypothetical protein JW905_06010 [bacterium]|nr:hypothetical protein [candidate division CSSED10-310 bacterium]